MVKNAGSLKTFPYANVILLDIGKHLAFVTATFKKVVNDKGFSQRERSVQSPSSKMSW